MFVMLRTIDGGRVFPVRAYYTRERAEHDMELLKNNSSFTYQIHEVPLV